MPPSHRRGTVSTCCSECEACCVLIGTRTDCFRELCCPLPFIPPYLFIHHPELVRPISGRGNENTIKIQAVPYNVTLRCVPASIVTVEKQLVLHITSVYL